MLHRLQTLLLQLSELSVNGKKVDAKRILGVMGLGAKKGAEITLRAEGEDEDAAIEKLSAFLQENL